MLTVCDVAGVAVEVPQLVVPCQYAVPLVALAVTAAELQNVPPPPVLSVGVTSLYVSTADDVVHVPVFL